MSFCHACGSSDHDGKTCGWLCRTCGLRKAGALGFGPPCHGHDPIDKEFTNVELSILAVAFLQAPTPVPEEDIRIIKELLKTIDITPKFKKAVKELVEVAISGKEFTAAREAVFEELTK